jgi:hypothetical protein
MFRHFRAPAQLALNAGSQRVGRLALAARHVHLRAQTMNAVNPYQQANQFPVDGFLTLDTVKALGVSAK